MGMAAHRPLKVAVLAKSRDRLEAWQLMVLDRLASEPLFDLASIIVHQTAPKVRVPKLFALEARLERRFLTHETPYLPKSFSPETQRFDDMGSRDLEMAESQDILRRLMQDLEVDIVIRMTPSGLPSGVSDALPFGEWALSCSDQVSDNVDWFAYRGTISKAASVELLLYKSGAPDGSVDVIASSFFNTKTSAARVAASIKERGVTLLIRELRRVAETRQLHVIARRPIPAIPPPSASDLGRYVATLAGDLAARCIKMLRKKLHSGSSVWALYTGGGHIEDFDPQQSVEIPPTMNEIKADPFLFEHENECYLFCEAYADGQKNAHIAVGRFRGDKLEHLGIALRCEHHLSYPFVFRDGEDIFMMPERHQSRQIQIWRCVEFPLKWELYSTALEGRSAADSVLMRHGGKWWLFTNLSDFHDYEDHCSELYVFEVDGPKLERVTPHRHNPVVIDSTLARNAGRMFERGGRLYRPSQRNAYGIYGYGLNIMEIDELSLDSYSERCIRTITPDFKKGLLGCHHFDEAANRYVLDARLT